MTAQQTTVFIENRMGRMTDVLNVLTENGVNIISLSLSDTAEYGLLRIISDNPVKAKQALSEAGFAAMLTEVFIVEVPHTPGALQSILRIIEEESLNVEYMYGLSVAGNKAFIVVKPSCPEKANEAFALRGIQTVSDKDLF